MLKILNLYNKSASLLNEIQIWVKTELTILGHFFNTNYCTFILFSQCTQKLCSFAFFVVFMGCFKLLKIKIKSHAMYLAL